MNRVEIKMRSKVHSCACLILLGCLVTAGVGSENLSPTALVSDQNGHLYIANHTANQIQELDIKTFAVTKVFTLPDSPSGLVMAPGSNTLYVTGGAANGVVWIINPAYGDVSHTIAVGHTPVSPVLNGQTLYVCNRFYNSISVIDVSTLQVTATIPVGREPVAMAVTPDGSHLLVAHHLPSGAANTNFTAMVVSVIDNYSQTTLQEIALHNGSTGGRGICISPDGNFAYVTHVIGRYQMPTTQLERGWIVTNAITVIDINAGELLNTVLLDNIYMGAANPWAVACTEEGTYLCVTHAGSQEVSVIDRIGLHNRLQDIAAGIPVPDGFSDSAADVPNDMGFLAGLRRRVPLVGNGPRSIVLVGSQAYVAQYYSDTLDVFEITSNTPAVQSIPLGPQNQPSQIRLGEIYFNDATQTYQKWLSCASCHPDGRSDSLNWDLGNDGLGSPRNAKSMLFSHFTAPAMITGIRADAETAVRAGLKYIEFAARPEADAEAIDAYLKSMRPIPSPYLVNGRMSDAAMRGRELFFGQANCGACHNGQYYIDTSYPIQKYDVGTGRYPGEFLDTPTLVEIWRTAPYLQNGGAETMREVLTTYNPHDQHGTTSDLSEQQIDDLLEFVLSIGDGDAGGDVVDFGF